MIHLLEQAEKNHCLSKEEIIQLLSSGLDAELSATADRVRRKYVGDAVHLRGLIEFSNTCKQNCLYCGLRRDNRKVSRYHLEADVIVELARKAKDYGYWTVVLQSGEDDYYAVDRMTDTIRRIKALDVAITLSIGEKTREEYQAYKQAGADRFLLRIETTDSQLYDVLNPGMSHANRLRCLRDLKELGYEVGTGSLIGLPGQSVESLADDILFFKELDVDMVGLGPFVPNPDTPLIEQASECNFVISGVPISPLTMSLRMLAIVRLLLPDCNIPATTAMEALHPNGRMLALSGGANVVMPNVTEGDYRRMYVLYPGKICMDDTPAHCRQCITGKIQSIGRTVAEGYGFRKDNK